MGCGAQARRASPLVAHAAFPQPPCRLNAADNDGGAVKVENIQDTTPGLVELWKSRFVNNTAKTTGGALAVRLRRLASCPDDGRAQEDCAGRST
jgi:hypothetical protein